jgi:hypothetical protein
MKVSEERQEERKNSTNEECAGLERSEDEAKEKADLVS